MSEQCLTGCEFGSKIGTERTAAVCAARGLSAVAAQMRIDRRDTGSMEREIAYADKFASTRTAALDACPGPGETCGARDSGVTAEMYVVSQVVKPTIVDYERAFNEAAAGGAPRG